MTIGSADESPKSAGLIDNAPFAEPIRNLELLPGRYIDFLKKPMGDAMCFCLLDFLI